MHRKTSGTLDRVGQLTVGTWPQWSFRNRSSCCLSTTGLPPSLTTALEPVLPSCHPQSQGRPIGTGSSQLIDALPDSFLPDLPAFLEFLITTDGAGESKLTHEQGQNGAAGVEERTGGGPALKAARESEPHRLQGQFGTGQTPLADGTHIVGAADERAASVEVGAGYGAVAQGEKLPAERLEAYIVLQIPHSNVLQGIGKR